MDALNRRRFLGQALTGLGALGAAPSLVRSALAGEATIPRPCPPGAWKKRGILLEPVEPWEDDRIQNFTSPAEPLDGQRWRLWYSAGVRKNFNIGYAEGEPGGTWRRVPARCTPGKPEDAPLSIGNLPEAWKPTQVVHIAMKNGKHRLYFWVHGGGVLRYLAADSDDGRRYRVVNPNRPILYHPNDRAAKGVPSPDGVTLSKEKSKDRPEDEPLAPARLISNDATNVYQLPDGTFEMYSVALVPVPKDDPAYIAHDNAPGLVRVIDRYTSEDGLTFETRKRVIDRDAKDPSDQQFYYLAVTHTPRGRIGMLGHYRVEAQTMDIEWCFSEDGVKWQRPQRSAWLPRGDRTQVDSYGTYSGHNLVQHGGEWHLFYTGVNSAHNGKDSHGPSRNAVMYATTRSVWA